MKFIAVILLWCCACSGYLAAADSAPRRLTTRAAHAAKARARAAPAHGPARSLRLGVEAPQPWLAEVRAQNGARFSIPDPVPPGRSRQGRAVVLSTVARAQHRQHKALGTALFTWYMLEQSMPAEYKADRAGVRGDQRQTPATMREYFDWFKKTMIECGKHPRCRS